MPERLPRPEEIPLLERIKGIFNKQDKQDPLAEGGSAYNSIERQTRKDVWTHAITNPLYYFGNIWRYTFPAGLLLYSLTFLSIKGYPLRYYLAQPYLGTRSDYNRGHFGGGGSARFAGPMDEWATIFKKSQRNFSRT